MSVRSAELAREKRDLDQKLPDSFKGRFRRSEMEYDPTTNETKYIITLSNDIPE